MNWDDARVFLAVCRESTLRGAARVLGVDQATVGRRINALEKSLSATLFLRTSEGYALTAVGEAALQVFGETRLGRDQVGGGHQGEQSRRLVPAGSPDMALHLDQGSGQRFGHQHPATESASAGSASLARESVASASVSTGSSRIDGSGVPASAQFARGSTKIVA